MRSSCAIFLIYLLGAGAALAANTQLASDKPVVNFRLPVFTPEGNRAWMLRGSEALYPRQGQVSIKELNLSVFTGLPDGKVETLILSPAAQVSISDLTVRGDDSIRVINDKFEATGSVWNYSHKEKRVSINRHVRVILHTALNDILK
jgi:hypothetical protein